MGSNHLLVHNMHFDVIGQFGPAFVSLVLSDFTRSLLPLNFLLLWSIEGNFCIGCMILGATLYKIVFDWMASVLHSRSMTCNGMGL